VGFVYAEVRRRGQSQPRIESTRKPHGGLRGKCSQCLCACAGYDRLQERRGRFVPLWGIPAEFV
jgi:hypothetical protein